MKNSFDMLINILDTTVGGGGISELEARSIEIIQAKIQQRVKANKISKK